MPGLPDFTIFSNLVTELQALLKKLPKSVPPATRQDKICEVFIKIPIPFDPTQDWEVFNRRMDALFSEDLRDASGRLYHLKRGAFGLDMVIAYIVQVMAGGNLIWDIAAIKVDRLVRELKVLM